MAVHVVVKSKEVNILNKKNTLDIVILIFIYIFVDWFQKKVIDKVVFLLKILTVSHLDSDDL